MLKKMSCVAKGRPTILTLQHGASYQGLSAHSEPTVIIVRRFLPYETELRVYSSQQTDAQ